jgi:Na+-transporting NADH:ubiquinone oxidoreductase subunit NqrE
LAVCRGEAILYFFGRQLGWTLGIVCLARLNYKDVLLIPIHLILGIR